MIDIIHCITTLNLGGAEKQLLTLVKQQVSKGGKITVIYLKNHPELKLDFERAGAEVLDLLANKRFYKQVNLLRKFLKHKDAILHAHLPRSELLCALTRQQNYLILSKHNSEQFFPSSNPIISRYLARYVFRKASFCICISEAVKNFLLGIKEVYQTSKLDVVYYGHSSELNKFLVSNYSIRNQIGYANKFVVGTIARMVPQKNYKILLEAFSNLCKLNLDARLLVVGNGTHQKQFMELAKNLNIYNNLAWISKTSNIYDYLIAMDVFILASNYEGFGLVLLEAMQTNTPIIAANNSSIPEVMGEDYLGLFESGNIEDLTFKLLQSLDNSYRIKLTKNYSNRLSIFDPISMSNKIDACYQKAKQMKINT